MYLPVPGWASTTVPASSPTRSVRRGIWSELSYENYPDVFSDLFGADSVLLLDRDWIFGNNGGGTRVGNNAGLIRFGWLRRGLAQLLADRRFWGFQLAQFVRGKVNPAAATHAELGLRRELTLAAMIGIANSYGARGMRARFLEPALAAVPPAEGDFLTRELNLVRHMLHAYAEREVQQNPKTQQLFDVGLDGRPGVLPTIGSLDHRGSRVLALLRMFPPEQPALFTELGRFRLAPESRFAGDPTTA